MWTMYDPCRSANLKVWSKRCTLPMLCNMMIIIVHLIIIVDNLTLSLTYKRNTIDTNYKLHLLYIIFLDEFETILELGEILSVNACFLPLPIQVTINLYSPVLNTKWWHRNCPELLWWQILYGSIGLIQYLYLCLMYSRFIGPKYF